MTRLTSITLALCLVGISAQAQTVRIDGFDDLRLRAQVLRGINEANANGSHFSIVEGPADVAIVLTKGAINERRLAFTLSPAPGKGVVGVFSNTLGNRDLCGIVEHELGHVMGRAHDDHGVMGASYGPDTACR